MLSSRETGPIAEDAGVLHTMAVDVIIFAGLPPDNVFANKQINSPEDSRPLPYTLTLAPPKLGPIDG